MYDILQEKSHQKKEIIEFKGYNHNPNIDDGEFYDMQNLSSRYYPLLAPRNPRGTIATLTKINGLFAKNGQIYVDGTNFYYKGVLKGQVSDTKKQFASMGAYVIIFPDKLRFNTTTEAFESLEASFTTAANVSVTGCTIDGTDVDASGSLYAKITVAGINSNFKQYDGVNISGSISVLNGNKIIQAIGTNYIVVAGKIGSIQSHNGITITRNTPAMDFIVEQDNRIWGCSSANHEIYASKLGDPTNWNCYEGISTDSYTVTVGSDGDFTGAISFLGYILFMKEDCIHKVYGSKPANYQIFENACRGLAKGSEGSLAIVNDTLLYMSRYGVCAYSGSLPESISYAFGDMKYSNASGGAIGDKYYISMSDGTNYHMFVFDERIGTWHREDNTQALYFTYYDNKLYFSSGNKIMTVEGNDTEAIQWYGEFSDFAEKTMNKKYVSKLQFRIELDEKAFFEAKIMYEDSGVWEPIATYSGKIKKSVNADILIRRCDYYKIRLSGLGKFKLYSMSKTYSEGSDR